MVQGGGLNLKMNLMTGNEVKKESGMTRLPAPTAALSLSLSPARVFVVCSLFFKGSDGVGGEETEQPQVEGNSGALHLNRACNQVDAATSCFSFKTLHQNCRISNCVRALKPLWSQ